MLINLSNHSSRTDWQADQIKLAESFYGEIIDMTFPEIDPTDSIYAVKDLAMKYAEQCSALIEKYGKNQFNAIHIMGEMTFMYQFVKLMTEKRILCLASTTRRVKNSNGKDRGEFKFVSFRPYEEI